MSILTLAEAKAHLRVDDSAEDLLIQDCIDAASDQISQYLGRTVPWLDAASDPVAIPASVKQAAKLLVGDYYANREAQGEPLSRNIAVDYLLHFYRVGLGV